ncbi:MAG: glycoside hydrolase family protein [Draconibacterium sp.]|nr:glycoside hydrolase family protein [Draconibacterium sp.]
MDRFLFMPDLGGMTSDTWGAKNVNQRDINNGIEDDKWSYWGGNSRLMPDGKYHLFVCRWPENSPGGHTNWPQSVVVHAVATNPYGPYKVVGEVGKGHNPEWYISNSGKIVIYVIGGYYVSDNINGPWEHKEFDLDKRDRKIIEGLSNLSFVKREDGSFLMVCRGGGIWISKDGLSTWNQVTDKRVYPPVDSRFENPVIWKTNVQYHLIVNDWYGRIAWHLRSKDGIHWKTDAGEAYLPGIAKYKNGIIEDWFKFERIKVLQDNYGRAIQANFAVIDTLKNQDKSNDTHSSKNIIIPLMPGKLLTVLNKKPITENTKTIKLLIEAEPGFDPYNDIDFTTLRFGVPEVVDFGKGCKVKDIKKKGDDVVIVFYGENNGFTEDNFAGKLLGKIKMENWFSGTRICPELSISNHFCRPESRKLYTMVKD